MAYIANTAFEAKVTNAVFDETANITGVFQNSSNAPEICSAGFLCVRGDRLENNGYTGIKNKNAYYMKAAGASDNGPIYACNTYNVAQTIDPSTGNTYKIGANTLGLPIPAGERGTYTRIDFDGGDKKYRFGIGNASAELSTNTFFTIANGQLVPAAAAPTANGAVYFTLIETGTFPAVGTRAGFGYIDVEAHRVFAAAN